MSQKCHLYHQSKRTCAPFVVFSRFSLVVGILTIVLHEALTLKIFFLLVDPIEGALY
jgi:hypothetical protein